MVFWMNKKNNTPAALDNYSKALSLGGQDTLPELYKAAGLEFNFSAANIKRLMDFVKTEM